MTTLIECPLLFLFSFSIQIRKLRETNATLARTLQGQTESMKKVVDERDLLAIDLDRARRQVRLFHWKIHFLE